MNDRPPATSRRADAAAVVFALVFPAIFTWVYFVELAQSAPMLQQTAYAVGKVLQFGFPVVWVLAVRRAWRPFRLASFRGVVPGVLFGLAVLGSALLLYHVWLGPAGLLESSGEAIHRKVSGFGVDNFWKYFALGAFLSIAHSLLEEYYWRWFVFGQLRELVRPWVAVVVSSVGFMAHHVIILSIYFGWFSPAAVLFSLAVAVGGAVWAWIYHRTGSLAGPWLSHLIIDTAIFIIGYDLVRQFFAS